MANEKNAVPFDVDGCVHRHVHAQVADPNRRLDEGLSLRELEVREVQAEPADAERVARMDIGRDCRRVGALADAREQRHADCQHERDDAEREDREQRADDDAAACV